MRSQSVLQLGLLTKWTSTEEKTVQLLRLLADSHGPIRQAALQLALEGTWDPAIAEKLRPFVSEMLKKAGRSLHLPDGLCVRDLDLLSKRLSFGDSLGDESSTESAHVMVKVEPEASLRNMLTEWLPPSIAEMESSESQLSSRVSLEIISALPTSAAIDLHRSSHVHRVQVVKSSGAALGGEEIKELESVEIEDELSSSATSSLVIVETGVNNNLYWRSDRNRLLNSYFAIPSSTGEFKQSAKDAASITLPFVCWGSPAEYYVSMGALGRWPQASAAAKLSQPAGISHYDIR